MSNYTVRDIVRTAYEGDPVEMKKVMGDVMREKMASAINSRREEIIGGVFDSSTNEGE